MRFGQLRDGVRLGLYWSAFASVIVVPVGIALRSWEVPVLAVLLIMAVCVAGDLMVERGEGTRAIAMAVAWCAGAALALALIGFGVHAIVAFEPYCRSGAGFVCFETVGEQRVRNHMSAMLPILGGAGLLTVLVAVAVRAFRDPYR